MSQPENDRRIDYIELPAADVAAAKTFYSDVFGWEFTDYGPDYTSFKDGRLDGGFTSAPESAARGPLVIIYVTDLEAAQKQVESHGGTVSQDIFEFPGGRRFHFTDPAGNELGVWSDPVA